MGSTSGTFATPLAATLLATTPAAAGERELAGLRARHPRTCPRRRTRPRPRCRAGGAPRLAGRAQGRRTPRPRLRRCAPRERRPEARRWSRTMVSLPTFAINAVMLPTGKVAFWGRAPEGGRRRTREPVGVLALVFGDRRAHAPRPSADRPRRRPACRIARAAVLLRAVAARRRAAVRRRRQPRQPGLPRRRDARAGGARPRIHVRSLEPHVAGAAAPAARPLVSEPGRAGGRADCYSSRASTSRARDARTSRWRSSRPRRGAGESAR